MISHWGTLHHVQTRTAIRGRLSELLDTLTDATIDVLDAGARDGWSPATVDHALGVVDILVAAAAQHGGPLAAALEPLPTLTAAARRALSEDPPPAPRPGSPAARAEATDGSAVYRAWWEGRQYFPPLRAEPSAVTVQRAAYERAAATKIITREAARTASRLQPPRHAGTSPTCGATRPPAEPPPAEPPGHRRLHHPLHYPLHHRLHYPLRQPRLRPSGTAGQAAVAAW